jgi:hypothetical protein
MYFHNQIIIADELGICNPYQKTEVETYKDTMFVHKTKQWYPEMQPDTLKRKRMETCRKKMFWAIILEVVGCGDRFKL